MSIEASVVQQLVSSITSLVDDYAMQDRQTPAAKKNECRWMIAAVLEPHTTGNRKEDTPLLTAVSKPLNFEYGRGFGVSCLRDWLEVYRAFPKKEEIGFDLTWAHYLALSKEPDHDRRLQLMQKAKQKRWSSDSLAFRIPGVPHSYRCSFEIADQLILDLARSYSCSCGILSAKELRSIYLEVCQEPVDEFDFQETLLCMDSVSSKEDEPRLWSHHGVTYVMDRALADPVAEDEPAYDYGEWGWNRTYVRPSAFLGALRRSHEAYVERRRAELIEAHAGAPIRRLGTAVGEARGLSSLPCWRSVEHLKEYCIGDVVASRTYSGSYKTAFDRGISQLIRHVSQYGIPSDEEIDEDARFLLARTKYSRDCWDNREHRSQQYVADVLRSIYWQVPLWEENGWSAQDLDEEALERSA